MWENKTITPNIVVSVGVIALVGLIPLYLSNFQVVLGTEIIIWGLLALSFNVSYGYTGMLSFGQSIFFGTGAYFLVYGLKWGVGLALTLLLVALASGILGLITGAIVTRVKGAKFFLVTLVGAILFHLVALDNRWLTGGDDGLFVPAGVEGIASNYYLVFTLALLVSLVVVILVCSPVGLILRMIKENPRRAELLGYWTDGYKIFSFAVGAVIAGLAGGLYGYSTGFVSADFFSWSHSADALVWTILGGSGTIAGPFIGAAALTFLRESLSSMWGKVYPVIVGGLLVGLVVVLPGGIVGMLDRVLIYIRDRFGEKV